MCRDRGRGWKINLSVLAVGAKPTVFGGGDGFLAFSGLGFFWLLAFSGLGFFWLLAFWFFGFWLLAFGKIGFWLLWLLANRFLVSGSWASLAFLSCLVFGFLAFGFFYVFWFFGSFGFGFLAFGKLAKCGGWVRVWVAQRPPACAVLRGGLVIAPPPTS